MSLAAALALGSAPAGATVIGPQQLPNAPGGLVDTLGQLGARPGATRLPVSISDSVQATVDVGTGNVAVSIAGLSVPGVSGASGVGVTGNSKSTERSTTSALPQRFELTAGAAGALHRVSDGVLYESGDGYAVKFPFVSGSTSQFTSPVGVKADLVRVGTVFTLTSRTTGTVSKFNEDGQVLSVADRNGNTTTYTHTNGVISKVVGSSGPAGARTANITTSASAVKVTQTSSGQTRAVTFEKNSNNDLTGFVDANGERTTFETSAGQVRKITSPAGRQTRFEYDSTDRLIKLIRVHSDGKQSVTRLAYPTGTQTQVAGPNTNQSQPVNAVPRTSYTLNSADRVTAATDPMGRAQSKTYTADFDTASATSGAGTTAGTTTNTFGANNGQSMTKSSSPTGAAGSAEYGNTASATKYLPTSGTDSAGNKSLYTYNGAGNQLSTTDASAAQAKLTYNTDGTVATATAPGNGTNATRYTYNANKQLTKITPVTGSSLGAQTFTYDGWGRTATATDGRGRTITYSYDTMGRVTKESYSDATPEVSYAYDEDGLLRNRSTSGTNSTSWTYDSLQRLTKRKQTYPGMPGQTRAVILPTSIEVDYGYDLASNQTSVSDGRGTTSYEFDASGTPTSMLYDTDAGKKRLDIATDNRGRRTDVWMDTNTTRTQWATHQHTDYDKSGRVSRVITKAANSDGTTTTVQDKTYCHSSGTTPAGGCTTTTANDRAKIQWVKDAAAGSNTTYQYDTRGQLIKATRTGGDAPKTYTYTYDARGNRLTAAATGETTKTHTYDSANQITNAGLRDAAGNLTNTEGNFLQYNAAGQLTRVTQIVDKESREYDYTYSGGTQAELVRQETNGSVYSYGYGKTNQFGLPVIEQVDRSGQPAYIENDPVTGQPLMLRTDDGTRSLYIYDGIGNPEALVTGQDETAIAYDYDPYGVPAITEDAGGQEEITNPFQFKGSLYDRNTDWVKFGHRWYSPELGRFTQRDTLDAPLDPANANRYTFAANDPINNVDPLGLYTLEEGAKACLAGAFTSVAFGLAFAGPSAGASLVASAATGCGVEIAIGIASEALATSPGQEAGYQAGFNAIALGLELAGALGKIL